MTSKTQKLTRMSRRRFVETLAGIGLSTEAVRHMTKEKLANLTGDPADEVPRIGGLRQPDDNKSPPFTDPADREPVYYTISKDKFIKVETAFDASKRLQKKVNRLDDSGLVHTSVQIGDKEGRDEYTVNVNKVTKLPSNAPLNAKNISPSAAANLNQAQTANVSLDKLRGELPDTVYGKAGYDGLSVGEREEIEINFSESVEMIDETCQVTDGSNTRFYEDKFRYGDTSVAGKRVPTGCKIHIDPEGHHSVLTVGPRIWKNKNSPEPSFLGFLTSAHGTFENEDPTNGVGRTVVQGDPGGWWPPWEGVDNRIGEVHEVHHEDMQDVPFPTDFALIKPDEEPWAGAKLASQGNSTTNGSLSSTRIGKDYLKDKEGPLHKQGYRTGRCTHTIHTIVERDNSVDQIYVYKDNWDGSGNSGAPYWADVSGEKRVASVHHATSHHDMPSRPGEVPLGISQWIGDYENMVNGEVW